MGSSQSLSRSEPPTNNEIFNIRTNDAGDSPPSKELIEQPHDRSDGSDLGFGELLENRSEGLDGSAMESFDIEEQHDRSDGSDVGLGELLENRSGDGVDESVCEMLPTPSTSILKPSAQAIDEGAEGSRRGNLKRKRSTETGGEPAGKNRRISFDSVTVYYFPREQGFTSVPSQGGSTLGMTSQHTHVENYSVPEHAKARKRKRGQGSTGKKHVPNKKTVSTSDVKESGASESEVQSDSEEKPLQPVPTQQRRLLLQAAGVPKIDSTEKEECNEIRKSRNLCGCDCKISCDPDTCSCSQAGIECLVENSNFPCGCSQQHCRNSSGRSEFNQVTMKTHVIDTLMRLDLNKNN